MSSVFRFDSHSEEETRDFGRKLAALLPQKAVILLIGELGAGKTTLTKGIVEGRGAAAAEDVSSPTFTLIHEYGDPVSVYHVDLYRLESPEQARRLGLDDLFDQSALLLIEWGDRWPELMPEYRIEIRLFHETEDSRRIEVSGLSRSVSARTLSI
jgi:tRNA threonylcarbamoyladenosine biosynthesis protein TsaE